MKTVRAKDFGAGAVNQMFWHRSLNEYLEAADFPFRVGFDGFSPSPGERQVMEVIVKLVDSKGLTTLEHPEMCLHPAWQAKLAQLFLYDMERKQERWKASGKDNQ